MGNRYKRTNDGAILLPSHADMMFARDRFGDLLGSRTKESDWQDFFADNPFVLSLALPLRLKPQDIRPLGRPGQAEPDFVFYPSDQKTIPFYGVIELKRPDSKIVNVSRSNVAILTADARTAVEQSRAYSTDLGRRLITPNRSMLCLGNEAFMFVIMGMSDELSRKLGLELFHQQVQGSLPPNLQLIPYDTLLQRFVDGFDIPILTLAPDLQRVDQIEELATDASGIVNIAPVDDRGRFRRFFQRIRRLGDTEMQGCG